MFYAQSTISREHKKKKKKKKKKRGKKTEKERGKKKRGGGGGGKKKVPRQQPRCRRIKAQTCRKVKSTDSPELLHRHNQNIRYVWLPFEAHVDRLIGRRSQ